MTEEHLFLLGGSGETGIIFISQLIALGDAAPLVTLYIRASGRAKLPAGVHSNARFRVTEGELTDRKTLVKSLSADAKFPPVTTVISFLGAYMSLYYFLTRRKPTPIADAFNTSILPAMREAGVKRIIALSTPSGFQYPEETSKISWAWWAKIHIPRIMVPQGDAEMRDIAKAVLYAGAEDKDLDWTIYRVGYLGDANPDISIVVKETLLNFEGDSVTRGSLSKWLLQEVEERKWLRKAPLVGNTAK
ncbi:uncharacterized protein HMPREF1541_03451 [Cyphellophora europaea CBS 101466]|uniref:NAD(P)-binding domain-containing protein n=1 Tax=Cyphellophora europaea (strain CBS 101466) TaxID=1220924 RepID=W2RYW0_CYPE1|nr:uncharacterized protein HMPREF1541_03451 [Cyphellophora europaea CBS 101466]ETN41515.1 hypothetical protein HMPREF1541_03451 [Cyphellophora europaea CBS 101466]